MFMKILVTLLMVYIPLLMYSGGIYTVHIYHSVYHLVYLRTQEETSTVKQVLLRKSYCCFFILKSPVLHTTFMLFVPSIKEQVES